MSHKQNHSQVRRNIITLIFPDKTMHTTLSFMVPIFKNGKTSQVDKIASGWSYKTSKLWKIHFHNVSMKKNFSMNRRMGNCFVHITYSELGADQLATMH